MRKWVRTAGLSLVGLLCFGCLGDGEGDSPAELLRAAVHAMGSDADLASLGPVAVYASGTLDKAAEGQGFSPFVPAPGRYLETTAIDPLGSAALWDYREERFDGTREDFGESHPAPGLKHLWLHDLGIVVPLRSAGFDQERAGIRRRFPHVLIRELLNRPAGLQVLDPSEGVRHVQGSFESGPPVTLSLDATTSFLHEVSYEQVLPGRGPVTIRWWYRDYREVSPGVWFPTEYGSTVGALEYTTMTVDSVSARGLSVFDPPEDLRLLEVRDAAPPVDPSPLELRRLAPGLYTVPDVRSGFAPLVVEFDDFLVAVDAPASFPLLGRIPAGQTDPAASMSWQSERFVDLLGQQWPEKPISYLVLTHHHEDHVGGVRAFIAAGTTILGPGSAIDVAERLAGLSPGVIDDRLAASPQPLSSEIVDGSRRITDGSRSIDLISARENPHANGMVIVFLPESATVYVSDLLTPGPLGGYPSSNHRALDDWFGSWLRDWGLDVDSAWTMHGDEPLTRQHLMVLGLGPGSGDIQ